MKIKALISALILSAATMQTSAFAGDRPTTPNEPAVAEPNDLVGVRCHLWTIPKGESKSCTCYDGTIKSINNKTVSIEVTRYRLKTTKRILGLEGQFIDNWEEPDTKEVAIPMSEVELIKFKIAK